MLNKKIFLTLVSTLVISLTACNGNNDNSFNSSSTLSTLSSANDIAERIEIDSLNCQTIYMVEDSFKRPTVYAYYYLSGKKDISKEVKISGYDMKKAGLQNISVSYESLECSYEINVCEDEFDFFSANLRRYQGHTNKKTFTTVRENGYLMTGGSGNDFLVITLKDVGTAVKYTLDESYILDTNGVVAYLNNDGSVDESTNYETQIYDDKSFCYKVTYYEKLDWDNTYSKVQYSGDTVETNYDVGFSMSYISDASYMKKLKNDINYKVETSNFECKIENNAWHFGYKLSNYDIDTGGQKVISKSYEFDTVLTIENGLGSHVEQIYTYTEYYGGVACGYVKATTSCDYFNGEFSEFTGKLLPYVGA